jgi:hypothetical protein
MLSELANIREHWVRYRDVTLQHLDMLAEEQMAWRPQPDSCADTGRLRHANRCEFGRGQACTKRPDGIATSMVALVRA